MATSNSTTDKEIARLRAAGKHALADSFVALKRRPRELDAEFYNNERIAELNIRRLEVPGTE